MNSWPQFSSRDPFAWGQLQQTSVMGHSFERWKLYKLQPPLEMQEIHPKQTSIWQSMNIIFFVIDYAPGARFFSVFPATSACLPRHRWKRSKKGVGPKVLFGRWCKHWMVIVWQAVFVLALCGPPKVDGQVCSKNLQPSLVQHPTKARAWRQSKLVANFRKLWHSQQATKEQRSQQAKNGGGGDLRMLSLSWSLLVPWKLVWTVGKK